MHFKSNFVLHIFWFEVLFLFFSNISSEKYKGTRREKIFEENLIVPHLLPNNPDEICTVIYEPNLIITPGQPYYSYQIQGLPEVTWDYKVGNFYTVVVLGAIQKENKYPCTTASVLKNDTDHTPSPPQDWWHHWVVVDVRKNNLNSGIIIQPLSVNVPQPNDTHKIVYAFAVFEQAKQLHLNLDSKENSRAILQRHFTPLTNFAKNFNGSVLTAGNFFYAVLKPKGLVLDTSQLRYPFWGF